MYVIYTLDKGEIYMSLQVGFNVNNYIDQYAGYIKGSPKADVPRTSDTNNPEVPIVENAHDDKLMKKIGVTECKTCQNRKYVDGSDDPGVSFKTPTHVSVESSGAAVMAHEQEHVSREGAKAQAEGRKVVSQSVQIFTAVCPECGRKYTSGGRTITTTKTDNSTDYFMDNMRKFFGNHYGKYIDIKV